MAYSFGGGVRPELGRTDFTPFLQGSVQGAQMQARGAENFAKGVASAGDSVAQGVKTYFANKELVASRIGKIEGGMSDPEVMKRVMASGEGSKLLKTMQDKGTLSLKDSALLFSLVDAAQDGVATDMKRQMMDAQTELARLQVSSLGAKQRDQTLVGGAVMGATDEEGNVNWTAAARNFIDSGGQDLSTISSLAEQARKTNWKSKSYTVKSPEGIEVQVVETSPNSVQLVPTVNENTTVPAQIQLLQAKAEMARAIPELLRKGDNEQALAYAIGLDIRNPFGTTDIDYVRSQFGLPQSASEPEIDPVAAARAIVQPSQAGPALPPPVASEAPAVATPPQAPVAEPAAPRVPLTQEERAARNQQNRERLVGFLQSLPGAAASGLNRFSEADRAFSGTVANASTALGQFMVDFVTNTNDTPESVARLRSLAEIASTERQRASLLNQAKSMEARIQRSQG
jgi:hypothetical protein